jgi:ribosomal protein S18 acetylase RimI-like enzyme
MSTLQLRTAELSDADEIARLHADSWQRHYRGVYSDSYLDGDVLADRIEVWRSRLGPESEGKKRKTLTTRADDESGLVGFVHVVFDDDEKWGSLLDNLHVTYAKKRRGIGRVLFTHAAAAVAQSARSPSMYLWVQQLNVAAQDFYRANHGTCVETAKVGLPGGVPGRLHGSPNKLRFAWPDARQSFAPR